MYTSPHQQKSANLFIAFNMNTRKICILLKKKIAVFFLPQTGDEGVDMSSTQTGYTHTHIQREIRPISFK